jgi:acetyltransferase-like isoleucine patch superfamily enzyme
MIKKTFCNTSNVLGYYSDRLFNFIIPNLRKFHQSFLIFDNFPVCSQITCISGLGQVTIGKNCRFGFKRGGFHRKGCIELQARYKNSRIILGENISTNNNVFICSANLIKIEKNTLIGQNVSIMDFEAHGSDPLKRGEVGEIGKVVIEENVWIGNNVLILKNSFIGKNSIVAAGAVVSGTFPANVIIGGLPAKVIKRIE